MSSGPVCTSPTPPTGTRSPGRTARSSPTYAPPRPPWSWPDCSIRPGWSRSKPRPSCRMPRHDTVLARGAGRSDNGAVSAQEIDQYLDALEEPKRTTLARLRQTILDVLPEAEQGISYGLPAFKVRGKTIAGFAAFKHHLSYLPHSGSVFPQLKDELEGYSTSSGALRFRIDQPLPAPLVEKLIAVRLQQAFPA